MHCWTKLGGIALEDLVDGCLRLENALPAWCHMYHELSFMSSLIGQNGEVLIINSDKTRLQAILNLSDTEFNSRWNAWRVGAAHNPAFIIPWNAWRVGAAHNPAFIIP
ncbi:unnamed protein product [Urochloa humidicola]